MSKNIKKGYQLHITTWENDGDSYKTKIKNGLIKEDILFLLDIAKRFTCKHDRNPGFGNGGVGGEDLYNIVKEALDKNPNASHQVRDDWEEACKEYKQLEEADEVDEDKWSEWLHQVLVDTLLGYPENEYYSDIYQFCRVFSSFKVFYYPEEVQDVTEEFK